jgi:uncharacterized protein (DUF934 family)
MPVIRNGQWSDDAWAHLDDDAELPATGAITVSLKRFHAEREVLTARSAPIGLRLTPEDRAHHVGNIAKHFALIVVEMPVFRDGRAFSQARLLRERYGYTGEIRAVGHVLPDQALFLARCGVNTIEVKPQTRLGPFAEALNEYSVGYQGSRAGKGVAPQLRTRPRAPALAQAAE